ncbi:MAG: hypothetical protein APF84_17155 [Gracilibacter sp. BRH_c7a]|nr:MAG: hypothetical protein APF84_17155 [Gracilibacter sp. BRH_c7a]
MKMVPFVNLVEPVPIRIGAILRLARIANMETIKSIANKFNFSAQSLSAYETGTRTVSETNYPELIKITLDLLDSIIASNNNHQDLLYKKNKTDKFIKKLDSLYYKEQLLLTLSDFFPVCYIGTKVLGHYLTLNKHVHLDKNCPPYPNRYYEKDHTPQADDILLEWLGSRKLNQRNFRSLFAKWLVLENRFISKMYAGLDTTIQHADKYFRNNKTKHYVPYTNLSMFCDNALRDDLFFEHPGPAIDALLVFSESIELSKNFSKIKVKVRLETDEQSSKDINSDNNTIEVYAFWTAQKI